MTNLKRYLVTVDDDNRNNLLEVADELQKSGVQVEQLMDSLGIIGISVEDDKINDIYQLEGVASVTSGEEELEAI